MASPSSSHSGDDSDESVGVSRDQVMSMYIESASQMRKRTTKAVRTDPGKKKAKSSSSTELAQGQLWLSVAKMKYDEAKSRGVQNKGQTGKKVFINRDADYDTALERIREELYGTTKMKDMSSLRDYIAYARSYIQPSLSEEAGQTLIQAYVDMRKIGSSRGAVTAYPRQLESLIRLAEAHAKMRFSATVEIVDVEEAKRLHREALKQSATDPKTGIIDVGILTTGVSSSERARRQLLAKEILKLLQSKAKSGTQLKTQALLEMVQAQSQVPVSQAQFEAALRILRDEDAITVTGQTVRIC